MTLYEELMARGLIDTISHEELKEKLNLGGLKFYTGYDPTAPSLQLGNLLVIITQLRLQKAGHTPFIVVGGATGMIGDPSGKSAERNLLDDKTLQANIEAQTQQFHRFFDFSSKANSAVIVNNFDWMKKMSYLEFLRDIGKCFRLSEMIAKDSVKSRLEQESGISYTEFSYQILQAYDFAYLCKHHQVKLQIGGSDQWGNMTAGVDLSRKLHGEQVYCLTIPLVTDSQGKKFGKSEGGNAIYLDAQMTSPYKMYQFLLNSEDQSVIRYLKLFSFRSLKEIDQLEKITQERPEERSAQKALAEELVAFVHGPKGLESALRATGFFFGQTIENVNDSEIDSIFADIPSVEMPRSQLGSVNIVDMLAQTPLFKSKGEARRSLQQKGVYLNNRPILEGEAIVDKKLLASESALILRKGKKNYCLVRFKN